MSYACIERDPDARPPKTPGQRVAYGIHGVFKWVKTPEFLVSSLRPVITVNMLMACGYSSRSGWSSCPLGFGFRQLSGLLLVSHPYSYEIIVTVLMLRIRLCVRSARCMVRQ